MMIGSFFLVFYSIYFFECKERCFYSFCVLQDFYLHFLYYFILCLILRIVRMQLMMSIDERTKIQQYNTSILTVCWCCLFKMMLFIVRTHQNRKSFQPPYQTHIITNPIITIKNASMATIIKVISIEHWDHSFVYFSFSSAFNRNSKVTRNC